MNLGIMQGRLSLPVEGHIQEFPFHWMGEFMLLKKAQLNHLEWLVTEKSFRNNPILVPQYSLNYVPISSICADNLVDERITDKEFLFSNLIPICEGAIKNGVPRITIPLLEASSVEDDEKRGTFSKLISELAFRYRYLKFSFEAELEPKKLLQILNKMPNFFVTYDTGNVTSCGFDHRVCVNLLAKHIDNVHLKDRTYDAKTVEPGTGDTDFKLIFQLLKEIDYNGPYTLQTARGTTGKEYETIIKHKELFEGIYNE
jgi:hexulose-6-phosphate isomerase